MPQPCLEPRTPRSPQGSFFCENVLNSGGKCYFAAGLKPSVWAAWCTLSIPLDMPTVSRWPQFGKPRTHTKMYIRNLEEQPLSFVLGDHCF